MSVAERYNMMIVDDVETNRIILKAIFESLYEVFEAENGEKAIETLERQHIDIMLLDLVMPVMDGFEVLAQLRADERWKNIPVVVNTGDNTTATEKKALAAGADDFITKPYDPAVVRLRVANVMAKRTLDKIRLERDLWETRAQLTSLIDSVPGGIVTIQMTDPPRILYANDALFDMFDISREEYERRVTSGQRCIMLTAEQVDELETGCRQLIEQHLPIDMNIRVQSSGALGKWLRINGSFLREDEEGRLIYQCVVTDVTQAKNAEQEIVKAYEDLRFSTRHDELTGLYNYRTFVSEATAELQEEMDVEHVVLCWNIERFKAVNELFGNAGGDQVIMALAHLIDDMFIGKGTYGRMGADSFIACIRADDLRLPDLHERLGTCFDNLEIPLHDILVDTGIYAIDDIKVPVEVMCDRANTAVRSIRDDYYRWYAYYDEELHRKLATEQLMTSEMEDALSSGQFKVYYQPVYSLATGTIAAAEALVRWIHPTRGVISPAMFIPLFEHNGFITRLDAFVWEEAIKTIRRMIDDGVQPIPLSINASRIDFFNTGIAEQIIELTERYEVDASLIRVEITESAFVSDSDYILKAMKTLQDNGFLILMDDFGSGFSSFNALKDTPVDILKIDLGFMGDMENSERAGNIVASIVSMSRWLKMDVIAEGVETKEQIDYLKSIECDYGQGYYFSQPIPEESLRELMSSEPMVDLTDDTEVHIQGLDFENAWENSNRVNNVLDTLVGGICVFELTVEDHVSFHYANNAFYTMLGSSPQHIFQLKDEGEWLFPGDRDALVACCHDSIRTDQVAHVQIRCTLVDSTQHWISAHIRFLTHHAAGGYLLAAIMEDVTQAQEREAELERKRVTSDRFFRKQSEMYRILVEDSSLLTVDYSPRERVIHLSVRMPDGSRKAFRASANTNGAGLEHLFSEEQRTLLFSKIEQILDRQAESDFEMSRLTGKSGSNRVQEVHLKSIADKDGEVFRVIGSMRDIEDIKQLEIKAQIDGLSMLLNRASFFESVEYELRSHPEVECAFLLYDIDNFKLVNDTLGHLAGDKLIRNFADVLRKHYRSVDLIGRLGGDEFAVLLRGDCSKRVIEAKAKATILSAQSISKRLGWNFDLSVSVGIAVSESSDLEVMDLYSAADEALYDVKREGKASYKIIGDVAKPVSDRRGI